METDDELDKQTEIILKKLEEAGSNSKKYYASNVVPGDFKPINLFEAALAFDTASLLETEFKILLAKRCKPQRWEEAIVSFEREAKRLRKKIEHWKKRELPPWDNV